MRRTSDTHPPTATATTMQRWCRALFCCICFSQHVNFNFVAANVDVHWFRDHPAATPTTTTTTRGAASRLLGSSQITPQIVGGTDAAERRFPYYVAMYRQDNSFICGGSLIAPDVVLTAAHCNVLGLDYVLVGKYHRDISIDDGEDKIQIKKVYPHPDFDYEKRIYDQMLLLLEHRSTHPCIKNINFNNNIPIPEVDKVTVIGLGRLAQGGTLADVLQQGEVESITNDVCEQTADGEYSYANVIKDDMLCLVSDDAGKDEGQCNGDSGGPVLLLGSSYMDDIQVATVSWGTECAHPVMPSVASRTSATDFVRDVTCAITSEPSTTIMMCQPVPTASPAPSMDGVVAVELSIQVHPYNISDLSWKLTDVDEEIVYARAWPATHNEGATVHTVHLLPGEPYKLIVDGTDEDATLGVEIIYNITLVDQSINLILSEGNKVYTAPQIYEFTVPTEDEYPKPPVPTASPAPSQFTVLVYLTIYFDRWHDETSWTITSDYDTSIVYADIPPDTYQHGDSVVEEVALPPGGTYQFTIRDEFCDGILVDGIAYEITVENPFSGQRIVLLDGDGDFGFERMSTFQIPVFSSTSSPTIIPTSAPTVIPSAAPTIFPTPAPMPTPTCLEETYPCTSHDECCSNRCVSLVCRPEVGTGSGNSGRPSFGKNGIRGGAGGSASTRYGG